MARSNAPTIPDDKVEFYREQLYRELSHMFEWTDLPTTIPRDYLERTLVRNGNVMFYYDESIGLDILRAEVLGLNRHDQPVTARSNVTATVEMYSQVERKIKRLTDSDNAIDEFDINTDAVLIRNMENGQSCREIVDYFAERLALVQQAFDTNLLWQNVPYIFQVDNNDMKISIEKLFSDIFSGKPFTIVDKHLLASNQDRTGVPTEIKFIGKELMDTRNEIMMKFRETVGITTAGVDKAERVTVAETTSNVQHTKTVLQIMLEQRQIACESINAFFGEKISVDVVGADLMEHEDQEEGDEEHGTGDSGAEEPTQD